MFKTMQRQLHRPPAVGKAKVIRRAIISTIFIATFFVFQMLQLAKVGPALDGQYNSIVAATATSQRIADDLMKQYDTKFKGASDKLSADKVFTQSPLSDRMSKGIEYETNAAQQEAVQAHGTVILFDIFQWVLPGAVDTVNSHNQRLSDFFKSDTYKNSVIANEKVKDLNAAIQYCQGTPLGIDKDGFGYAEAEGKYLTTAQKTTRADLINAAADRTICADIPKLKK